MKFALQFAATVPHCKRHWLYSLWRELLTGALLTVWCACFFCRCTPGVGFCLLIIYSTAMEMLRKIFSNRYDYHVIKKSNALERHQFKISYFISQLLNVGYSGAWSFDDLRSTRFQVCNLSLLFYCRSWGQEKTLWKENLSHQTSAWALRAVDPDQEQPGVEK